MNIQNKNPRVTVVLMPEGRTLWELDENYSYHWQHKGETFRFTIGRGFRFDGASVPWFLRWIAGRGRFGVLAPMVHDWMHERLGNVKPEILRGEVGNTMGELKNPRWQSYVVVVPDKYTGGGYTIYKSFTRRQADRLFFRIMRESGVKPRWLRRWAFRMVRLWSVLMGDNWR